MNFFSDVISNEVWHITTDTDEFISLKGAKINYSNDKINCDCITIIPHGLLFENQIRYQEISCTFKKGVTIFFQNSSFTSFDIFAASFYLISRYEEYLPYEKDKYGRYKHENSIAFKNGFLNKPLINIWIEKFKKTITEIYPNYNFKKNEFEFLPTYDIDMAWSYLHKGYLRNIGNIAKDFFTLSFSHFFERLSVLSGFAKDPFYNFDWLDQLHKQYQLAPYYFFLVAENKSVYDKNISPHHPQMQQLIESHSKKYSIGLHPSWQSGNGLGILKKEKQILESITGKIILSSRQHYIRLTLPDTYRILIKSGLLHDYSMGYPTINGFRASLASSYRWYDLERNQETSLTVYPFCFMEGNSIIHQNQTPEEGLQELTALYNEVKSINGFFSMIWHNIALTDEGICKGWRNIYEKFIKSVQ